VGGDVPHEEQQLVGIDPLTPPAVPLPEELLGLLLEAGDQSALPPKSLHLLADLAVGSVEVVGECGVGGRYTL